MVKLNTEQIEVPYDVSLIREIKSLFEMESPVTCVIESGTYLGTGTTRLFISAWEDSKKKEGQRLELITIEMQRDAFQKARQNLSGWDYVTVLHGASLGIEEMIQFVKTDPLLQDLSKYPGLFVDSEDSIHYYLTEIACNTNPFPGDGDNLFSQIIPDKRDKEKILFCLDSCGGTGKLEFERVCDLMEGREFYVLLDDIRHVKHARSFMRMLDPLGEEIFEWRLLYDNGRVALGQRKGE